MLTDFLISALIKFIMEPWVFFNLLKSWPVSWIIAEDGLHQILELSGDVRRFQGGPVGFVDTVGIALARLQEMVELIVHFSLTEGEVANDDGEEDDSERENISLPSVIFFRLPYLWSHVALGAPERVQSVDVLVSSKAKVGELKVHVVVE